jgi:hypothetical protein
MAGMKVRLLDSKETNEIFANDLQYQQILKKRVTPQCLEIVYGATANAAFTEIGTAMTAEFKGAAFEKTTVLCKTRVLTPGGSYFFFYVANSSGVVTTYYAWFSKYQVTTVQTLAAASITTGAYFTIADSQGSPTKYYVWMDKNGDGSTDDPGPVSGYTSAPVNISAATTADDVATATAAVLNALAGFGASATTDTVTITHATKGSPSEDAADVDTSFTITKVENGGSDPGVTGTGAECDIKGATTADNVGAVVAGVINALADVAAANSSGTVTITNAETFLVTATADGAIATGFTFTQVEQSADAYSGAPVYLVSASADDTDNPAKDMRKDTIIGFGAAISGSRTKPLLKSEEVALNGTTQVKTSELKWTRIIHHGGTDWGSAGQDAKGNIALENVDGTDFLVLTAGGNESEGGVIWIPNNFHAMIAEMELKLHDITVTTAGDGVIVRFVKSGDDDTKNNRIYNTDQDHPNIAITVTREKPDNKKKWPVKTIIHGTDVAKLTLQEAAINNVTDFIFRAYVIIWYESNS